MKHALITTLTLSLAAISLQGQNTFPGSGHVGIGTTSPQYPLEITVGGLTSPMRLNTGDATFTFARHSLDLRSQPWFNSYVPYISWLNNAGTRQAYLGWRSDVFNLTLENGFNFSINGGNVGIGTATTTERLTVSGGGIALDNDQPLRGGGKWLISGNQEAITVGTANLGMDLRLMAGANDPRLFVDGDTGGVGIGTLNPGSYRLAVDGKIGAREVNVTTGAWADYVFKKDYALRSIYELEKFIDTNHHLPEVPSEKEVLANGQNLGEMNVILLKKIEELTLYIIDQQKQIDALKKKVGEQ
jgi:hypothetical protein